jgi:FtsP/CotA-like multicopper oxidase with cupredoxin domain
VAKHDQEAQGGISRRDLLRAGAAGAVGMAAVSGAAALARPAAGAQQLPQIVHGGREHIHAMGTGGGDVDTSLFDPSVFLERFDLGTVSTLPDGRTLREYEITALDRPIEVAPGVHFEAWTYNGTVPGPTIRCTEGDRLRINFSNAGSHPHTIHFHGIHPAKMDGVFEIVDPGKSFTYEFDARPAGVQLYHCHAAPLKRHIHKGLYGAFIIDPKDTPLAPARELVMVMNGFDTNFDGENEVYAVNSVAFHYQRHPIQLQVGELVRLYLVNMTEFDLINSFHLHGNFFKYWRTGTRPDFYEYTDNIMLCQGERGVMEFAFEYPGLYMFHAHQSEFAELGWMGLFDVTGGVVV